MTTLHVYIGASGSGKTTKIIETHVHPAIPLHDGEEDGIKICEHGTTLLVGHYTVDRRCKGCDTLSMVILDKLIPFVEKIMQEGKYMDLIVDGDRINNVQFFEAIKKFKDNVILYYLDTPLEKIYQRLPECNKTFVKTTRTKSENCYNRYKTEFYTIHYKEQPHDWW